MSTIKVDTINTRTGSGNITFSRPTVLTAGDIVTADIANDAITTVKVADDAVTIAKLAATGTASSSTFLRGDNSWQEAGGGAWNLIGTAEASGSPSSLGVTGLDSTYDTYAIIIADLNFSTDTTGLRLKVGDSGGIETGSVYNYHVTVVAPGSTSYAGEVQAGFPFWSLTPGAGQGNLAAENFGGVYYLHSPGDSTGNIIMTGQSIGHKGDGTSIGGPIIGNMTTIQAISQVEITPGGGTFDNGRLSVYGISHS